MVTCPCKLLDPLKEKVITPVKGLGVSACYQLESLESYANLGNEGYLPDD